MTDCKSACHEGPKRFAVIGGGFAGVAVAWHLLGMTGGSGPTSVDLFDAVGLAGGGSGAAAGLLHPFTPRGKLLWHGQEAFISAMKLISAAELAASVACGERAHRPFVWRQPIMRPAMSARQAKDFSLFGSNAQNRAAMSIQARPITYEDARRLVPGLSETAIMDGASPAALLMKGGAVLDPQRYLRALWASCQQTSKDAGGQSRARLIREQVTSLHALEESHGPYTAMIVATGAAMGTIQEIGNRLKCELCQGYTLQLAPPRPRGPPSAAEEVRQVLEEQAVIRAAMPHFPGEHTAVGPASRLAPTPGFDARWGGPGVVGCPSLAAASAELALSLKVARDQAQAEATPLTSGQEGTDPEVDGTAARRMGEAGTAGSWDDRKQEGEPAHAYADGAGADAEQQREFRLIEELKSASPPFDAARQVMAASAEADMRECLVDTTGDSSDGEDVEEGSGVDLLQGYPVGSPSLLAAKYMAVQGRRRITVGATKRYNLTAHQAFEECGRVIPPEEAAAAAETLMPAAAQLWEPASQWRVHRVRSGVRALPPRTKLGSLPQAGRLEEDAHRWWVVGGLGARGLVYHAWLGEHVARAVLADDEGLLPLELLQWKDSSTP